MASRVRRKICVRVNPGEATDGSGQVCIHLFVQDETGPFVEPHVLHSLVEQEVFRARHTGLHHSQAPISNSADPEAQEPLPLEPIDGVTILDASED